MAGRRIAARLAQLAFWAAAAVALALALMPPPTTPPVIPWDKASHFLGFYVLTVLAVFAFPRRALLPLALALSGYGALIELLQVLLPLGRDGDVWDWVADTAAVAAALLPLGASRWRAWLGMNQ